MKYCLTSTVIAMFLLIPFVNIQRGFAEDGERLQKILEWWPTDANPGPVKDEIRGGHWWWPNKPGQVKPWGNRGYVYVKGGYTTKPLEKEFEAARKAEEKARKAKEAEEAKRKKEEEARIKKAKELEEVKRTKELEGARKARGEAEKAKAEEASRIKKAHEEAARIRKAQELEEAKRVKEEEAARIKKAQELEGAKRAKEEEARKAKALEEAKLAQKKESKKIEIHDTIVSDKDNILLVTDFSSGTKRVLGGFAGEFGTWENDPKDETQFCRMEIGETLDRFSKPDYFVRLNYDVGSPRPAFNGFWMKLNHLDITPYEYVSFLVKGENKFTTQFKIELKNKKGEKVVYFISGIIGDWQRIVVPLDKLKKVNAITDWTDMTEFVIVFDDIVATEKEGTICIDDLNFAKFGWEKAERRVR